MGWHSAHPHTFSLHYPSTQLGKQLWGCYGSLPESGVPPYQFPTQCFLPFSLQKGIVLPQDRAKCHAPHPGYVPMCNITTKGGQGSYCPDSLPPERIMGKDFKAPALNMGLIAPPWSIVGHLNWTTISTWLRTPPVLKCLGMKSSLPEPSCVPTYQARKCVSSQAGHLHISGFPRCLYICLFFYGSLTHSPKLTFCFKALVQ